jgi:3-oxoacyl-[acyl-carrier-protein] synthase II
MTHQRVVISGVGVVAPIGIGKEAFWQALLNGLSGVRSIRRYDTHSLGCRIGGEIIGFDPLRFFVANDLKKMDLGNLYALAAAQMALEDSGLVLESENLERFGSTIGNAIGGVDYVDHEIDVSRKRGGRSVSPYTAIAFFSCGTNGLISIRFKFKGVILTLCNGNTSGTDAIGIAYRTVQSGRADVMLAGGTEAPLIPLFLGSLAKDGFLSTRNADPESAPRPFDLGADGMVLGEGAALLVVESLEHAKARGAEIYAEIIGYAGGNSAFDALRPDPNGSGLMSTMHRAMSEAHIKVEDVHVIQGLGLSLREYDDMEARCIVQTFQEGGSNPWVTAVSSNVGNSLGALGGFQAASSVLSLQRQKVPTLLNFERGNPQFALRAITSIDRTEHLDVVMQNAYCFLGKTSTLLFRRYIS